MLLLFGPKGGGVVALELLGSSSRFTLMRLQREIWLKSHSHLLLKGT